MASKRPGQKISMLSVDELLGVPASEGSTEIEVSKIHAFKNHPFKVIDDDKMHDLVESIIVGYTVLLCFTLFKTGSLAKSIFAAH